MEQSYQQNDRVYAPKGKLKSDIDPARTLVEQRGFPCYLMVSVSVSKLEKTKLHFVEVKSKVNADYYRQKILRKMIPQMDKLAAGRKYLFMQDGAPAHLHMRPSNYLKLKISCSLYCLIVGHPTTALILIL